MLRLVLRIVVLAVIIGAVAKIVPGVEVIGGYGSLLWIAVLFSLVNAVVGPVLRILGLPFILLTLGLFLLVINAGLLGITAWLSSHLNVADFGTAVLGGFLIALFSWAAEVVLPLKKKAVKG